MKQAPLAIASVAFIVSVAVAAFTSSHRSASRDELTLAFSQGYLCGQKSMVDDARMPMRAPLIDDETAAQAQAAAADGFPVAKDCK